MPEESNGNNGRSQPIVDLVTGEPTFENNQVRIPIRLRLRPTEQPVEINTGLAFDLRTLEDFVSKLKDENK